MDNQRIWGFKTILILCVCVFCVYEMQEVALNKMDQVSHEISAAPRPVLSALDVHSLSINEIHHDVSHIEDIHKHIAVLKDEAPQVWITLGLCWSENAQVHGKENFPYKDAAPLSSQLWMKITPAKVVIQIVYSEAEVTNELKDYKHKLEGYGVIVYLVPTGNEMKCVLKSQLIRVLAFLLPEIKPTDTIVTADVDAFIMTPDIYKPLLLPKRQIWLYRYAFTLGSGSTFMMPFIGAKADVWRHMLEYDSSQDVLDEGLLGNGLPKMVDNYRSKMNFSETYTWDIDQHIVSYGILNSGLCSLPKDNKLWADLNTKPNIFDDRKTCWHGSGIYEDCNNVLWSRNIMIRYKGDNCKWWHFYPYETYTELRVKFQEIVAGQSENPLIHNLLNAAKKIQQKAFGKLLV